MNEGFGFLTTEKHHKSELDFPLMASTTAFQASYSPLLKPQNRTHLLQGFRAATRRAPNYKTRVRVSATQAPSPSQPRRAPPGVDTRIHWDNEDEGWVGGPSNSQQTKEKLNEEEQQKNLLGDKFADLLNDSSDSHYQ